MNYYEFCTQMEDVCLSLAHLTTSSEIGVLAIFAKASERYAQLRKEVINENKVDALALPEELEVLKSAKAYLDRQILKSRSE